MRKKSLFFFTIFLFALTIANAQKSPFDTAERTLFDNAQEFFAKNAYAAADRYYGNFEALVGENDSEELRICRRDRALCSYYLRRKDAQMRLEDYARRYSYAGDADKVKLYLGVLEYEKGKHKQAQKIFAGVDQTKLDDDDRVQFMYYRGCTYVKQNSWAEAVKQFEEITKLSENDYTRHAYYYAGYANYKNGNYQAALQNLYKVEKDSEFPDVPYLICLSLYADGNCSAMKDKALALLESGYETGKAELQRLVGVCSYLSEDYAQALDYMNQYVSAVKKMSREDWYITGIAYYKTEQWAKAVEYLGKAVSKADDEISQNAGFHIANAYMQLGDKEKARMAYESAARYKNDPQLREDALFNYAVLTYQSGYSPFNETLSVFERFLAEYPKSKYTDKVYECMVNVYLTTNNYSAAYASIQKIKTDNALIKEAEQRVLYGLATDAIANRQYGTAAKHLKNIVEAPKCYNADVCRKAQYWYAECLYKSKAYANAAGMYKRYLADSKSKKDAEYALAYYGLGYTHIRMGDYTQAVSTLERFCKLTNTDKAMRVDAFNRIGDCYLATRKYEAARNAYSTAFNHGAELPGTDYSLYSSGLIYGLQKKYSQKISVLDRLLKTYPKSDLADDAMLEIARAYIETGDNDKAISVLEEICGKYKKSNPVVRKSRLQIAMLYYNSGDVNRAVDNFKTIVQTYPKSEEAATALSTLEIIMVDNNRVDEFNAIAKSAGKTSATKEDSLSYKACERIYFKNDFKQAAPNFEKYLKNYPDGKYSSLARYYLANCYYQTGDKSKALQLYASIADDPGNPNLQLTLQRASAMSYEAGKYAEALELYSELREVGDAESRKEAKTGILRSAVKLGKHEEIISAADDILADGSGSDVNEARYQRMKSRMALGKDQAAVWTDAEELAKDTRSAYGAEAKYMILQRYADEKDYAKAEAEFFDFVEKGTPHFYWLAKGFLTISDVYVAQGNYFEAKQYLQSLKDNYSDMEEDIAEGLAKRMQQIEKHEKDSVSE